MRPGAAGGLFVHPRGCYGFARRSGGGERTTAMAACEAACRRLPCGSLAVGIPAELAPCEAGHAAGALAAVRPRVLPVTELAERRGR